MQNEFEKQVQEKLEELRLVPSDPVWEKVSMQIRPKKKRRWLIIWLVFAVMFTGTGIWVYHQSGVVLTAQEPVGPAVPANKIGNNGPSEKIVKENSATESEEVLRGTKENLVENRKANKTQAVPMKSRPPIRSNEAIVFKNQVPKKVARTFSGELADANKDKSVEATSMNDFEADSKDSVQVLYQDVARENLIKEASQDSSATTEDSLTLQKKFADTIQRAKMPVQLYAKKTWRFGVQASAGFTGLTTLDVFNGFTAADAFSNYNGSPSGGPGAVYRGQSPVKNGPAFSIGGVVQKQLSKRLGFETGLLYNYYSNSISVGNAVVRDTMFRYRYSVSQFFTNAGSMNAYKNEYHFLSVPVSLAWQLHKSAPVSLKAGLSVQHLIGSNALVFDFPAQAYYRNKDALRATQLISEFGLQYSWRMNKMALTIGPSLRYSLTSLEKDDGGNHLFSVGVNAQLLFDKK